MSMSFRIRLIRSRFFEEVGSSRTRVFSSPTTSYNCRMPGGINLGGITLNLQKLSLVQILTLFVQRASRSGNCQKGFTLLPPLEASPVLAFSVDDQKHCTEATLKTV